MARINPDGYIGKKYNRLTAVKYEGMGKDSRRLFTFQCDCGNKLVLSLKDVKQGHSKSCGCLKKETSAANGKSTTTHGLKHTRLYSIMNKMKSRCYNPNHDAYARYGGKGIRICDDWLNDISSFYNWAMANGYEDNLTIDRIDNDKGYYPENCRWATRTDQNRNRSISRRITLFGETKCLSEWLEDERVSVNKTLFYKRTKQGMDDVEALTKPVKK